MKTTTCLPLFEALEQGKTIQHTDFDLQVRMGEFRQLDMIGGKSDPDDVEFWLTIIYSNPQVWTVLHPEKA